jgi:hypothetical protein
MIIFKYLKAAHWPTIFVEVIILQTRRDDFILRIYHQVLIGAEKVQEIDQIAGS